MQDFIDVLLFLQSFIVRLLSIRVPLGPDFTISYGSIIFSIVFVPFLFRIVLNLFAFWGDKND